MDTKDQLMIYFGSPYTHEIPMLVARRYVEIFEITAEVFRLESRIVPFSPIAYTHQFGHLNVDWLKRADFRFLLASDAMVIVQIEGWAQSEGVLAEKRFCQRNDIPLFYATPDKVLERCREIFDEHFGVIMESRRRRLNVLSGRY